MPEPTSPEPEHRPIDPDNLPINPNEQVRVPSGAPSRGDQAPGRDQEPTARGGNEEGFAAGWNVDRSFSRETWDELDRVGVSKSDVDTWIQIRREYEQTGQISPENEILNSHIVEKLGLLDPAKQHEIMNIMLEATRQPDMALPELTSDSPSEAQTPEERAAAEHERKKQQSAQEAQAAVQAFLQNDNRDLDVDLRKKADEAIRKAREDADHENVHHYYGKDPKWVKFLTGLGLTFYAIVAMQYAVASAAEKMFKPGK